MVCVTCGENTQVINSRLQKRTNQVWRRRKCVGCKSIFTTTEMAEYNAIWAVIRKNRRLMPFSRDKLFLSIYDSLQHRMTAIADAEGITTTVITKLSPIIINGTVESSAVTTAVQVALNRFDRVASMHYQAFHKG